MKKKKEILERIGLLEIKRTDAINLENNEALALAIGSQIHLLKWVLEE